jgi:fumarate reductase iron-sulfur subunit
MPTYTIKVQRFDPSVDKEPYYKTYTVPYEDKDISQLSALKALRYINQFIESIGFDYNCRFGGCGRCGIMVDGIPKLACFAPLSEGKEHTLEPLQGFPVVRDLVIDRSKTYERFLNSSVSIKTLDPIVKPKPIEAELWWKTLNPLNRCKECMSCYAVCTALQVEKRWESFIGPGAMMQIYQRAMDTEDKADRISQAAFSGAFQCVQCGLCNTVCPAEIPIKENIADLQQRAAARNLKPSDTSAPNWPLL